MSINQTRRQFVRDRAGNCCEYGRVAEDGRLSRFQVDHIIAIKHDGTDANDVPLAWFEFPTTVTPDGSNLLAAWGTDGVIEAT